MADNGLFKVFFIIGSNSNPLDLDGDGVRNEDDECPNTPPGAIVHPNGCPIDI